MGKKRLFDDEHYNSQNNEAGVVKLESRGGSCLVKFLIGLLITVVIICIIGVVGLFVGNHFFTQYTGVTLWTAFDVVGDLKPHKDDESKIVYNAFSPDDLDDFYGTLNKSLFLKEDTPSAQLVDDLMSGLMSGEGDNPTDKLLELFSGDNIDKEYLASYDGWQEGKSHLAFMNAYTDRQFGAFLNNVIFSALSGANSQLPYGLTMEDVLTLNQVVVTKGSDFSTEDQTLYSVKGDEVYLALTMSLDLEQTLKTILSSDEIGIDIGGFSGIIFTFLPTDIYVSAVVSLEDVTYTPHYELNYLSHKTVSYKSETMSEAVEMTRMERIYDVVDTMVNKIGNQSDFSLKGTLDEVFENITPMLVRDDNAEFSLGNLMELQTVTKATAGNSYKIDILGAFTQMMDVPDLGASDFVVILQSIICPDTKDILDSAIGARLYVDPPTVDTSNARVYNDVADLPGDIDLTNPDLEGLLDGYSKELLEQLAKDYDIDTTYTVTDPETGEEVEVEYTMDDIYGAIGIGEPTDVSDKLKENITEKVEEIKESGETPKLNVTDKMMAAIVHKSIADASGDLSSYGLDMKILSLSKVQGENEVHDVVRVYTSFDFANLVGDNEQMADILDGLMGSNSILLSIDLDITKNLTESKLKTVVTLNGLEGKADYFNGLTTEVVVNSIRKFADFDLDTIMTEIEGLVDDALASMETNSLVGIEFVESGKEA